MNNLLNIHKKDNNIPMNNVFILSLQKIEIMTVQELQDKINQVEDKEGTIVVIPRHNENVKPGQLEEVDFVDFLYGEYVSFPTEESKINDIFVIY